MTAESRLYCINTTSSTVSPNPVLDTDGGSYSGAPITSALPPLFDSSGTISSENISTNNLFGLPLQVSDANFGAGNFFASSAVMTPAFTGDIFNMPLEMPNLDFCNQIFSNIMTGFQQQMKNMQAQFMQQMALTQPYYDEDTSYFSYDAQALKAKWSKAKPNLSEGFYNKVVEISKQIGCDPNELMGLMYSESGLDSRKSNSIGATGLIQFLPSTAKSLGTTCAALKAMSPEQQLDYVKQHLISCKRQAGISSNQKIDRGTLYALVFLPARANKTVLTQRGENYYDQNTALDVDNNGSITKSDLNARICSKIREATGTLA